MKTCPNCGSKMGADVNFCTSCGTDIRNVPLDNEVSVSQTTVDSQSASESINPISSQSTSSVSDAQSQSMSNAENNQNAGQAANLGQDFTQSVKNFDHRNMWQWFVNSWKHPFAEQNADKWYGWITLLAEDILIGLSIFIMAQRASGSIFGSDFASETSRFTFGTAFELMILLLLAEAAWIGSAFLTHKVIYGSSKNFLEFSNHVVQTSNLNAIFLVVAFVFSIISGLGGSVMIAILFYLAIIWFMMSLTVVVLGDPNPVHDKFYGYLLFIVLQALTGIILFVAIGGIIISQIGSAVPGFF